MRHPNAGWIWLAPGRAGDGDSLGLGATTRQGESILCDVLCDVRPRGPATNKSRGQSWPRRRRQGEIGEGVLQAPPLRGYSCPLPCRDNLTSGDLRWVGKQGGHILADKVRGSSVRFLRPSLVLKDARRHHHAVSGVDPVVRHEPWDLADDRQKALSTTRPASLGSGTPSYRRTVAYIGCSFRGTCRS
jgi:hypothetical protein